MEEVICSSFLIGASIKGKVWKGRRGKRKEGRGSSEILFFLPLSLLLILVLLPSFCVETEDEAAAFSLLLSSSSSLSVSLFFLPCRLESNFLFPSRLISLNKSRKEDGEKPGGETDSLLHLPGSSSCSARWNANGVFLSLLSLLSLFSSPKSLSLRQKVVLLHAKCNSFY